MKHLVTILLLICFTASAQAQATKKSEYTYNFPDVITGDLKTEFIKLFEKGKILFQINCAKCHTTTKDGVEAMQEFTKADLAKYEIRVMNPEHIEAISDTRVLPQELYQIMLFLGYCKKVDSTDQAVKPVEKTAAQGQRKR